MAHFHDYAAVGSSDRMPRPGHRSRVERNLKWRGVMGNVSANLRKYRWWLVLAAAVMLFLIFPQPFKDAMEGFRDGFRDGFGPR
jgi:hypothetical protein